MKPHGMIRKRDEAAGIKTKIGNHTFRATDTTAYLKNASSWRLPSRSLLMSRRGLGFYDRRDDVNLDEVEKISI